MANLQMIEGDRVTNFERVSIKKLDKPEAMVAHMTSFEDGDTGEEIIFGASSKRALMSYLAQQCDFTVDEKLIKQVVVVPSGHAELNWE